MAPMTLSPIQQDVTMRQDQQNELLCGNAENSLVQTVQRQQKQGTQNNVGELVAKAKKAAASLWMILHAQNCNMGKDKCQYSSCNDTKILLMHVKTCPAGPEFPCPTKFRGCNETRKLLAHYRRCKDIRMKQVASGRRSPMRQQQGAQACLVCSLMARHAKNMMEKSKQQTRHSNVSSMRLSNASSSSSVNSKFSIEKNLLNDGQLSCPTPAQSRSNGQKIARTPSMILMPPPPPRPRSQHGPSGQIMSIERNVSQESFGSPPSPSQLMHSKITTVAAITHPSPTEDSMSDPSLLGKSVDSSCFSSMANVPFPDLRNNFQTAEEVILPIPSSPRRQRSESYDERRTRVSWAPSCANPKEYNVVAEEKQFGPIPEHAPEVIDHETGHTQTIVRRPRAASCGNVVPPSNGCETIVEESKEHEDMFEMD